MRRTWKKRSFYSSSHGIVEERNVDDWEEWERDDTQNTENEPHARVRASYLPCDAPFEVGSKTDGSKSSDVPMPWMRKIDFLLSHPVDGFRRTRDAKQVSIDVEFVKERVSFASDHVHPIPSKGLARRILFVVDQIGKDRCLRSREGCPTHA